MRLGIKIDRKLLEFGKRVRKILYELKCEKSMRNLSKSSPGVRKPIRLGLRIRKLKKNT
jgi:hypothetical protein